MKNLKHFLRIAAMMVLTAFLFTACEQDTSLVTTEDGLTTITAETRVPAHPLPLMVNFNATPNPDYMPGQPNGWLGGQATHFGNLQSANSPFWYLGPPTPLPVPDHPDYPVRVPIFNHLTAANGDLAVAIGYLDLNPAIGTFIGHFDVIDNGNNTGRFVGVSGYADISPDNPGYIDQNTGISYWEAEGEITFQK